MRGLPARSPQGASTWRSSSAATTSSPAQSQCWTRQARRCHRCLLQCTSLPSAFFPRLVCGPAPLLRVVIFLLRRGTSSAAGNKEPAGSALCLHALICPESVALAPLACGSTQHCCPCSAGRHGVPVWAGEPEAPPGGYTAPGYTAPGYTEPGYTAPASSPVGSEHQSSRGAHAPAWLALSG